VSQRVPMCPNGSQRVSTGHNGSQRVSTGPNRSQRASLKLVGVCVEDSCMYLLYYGVVLYHASQLYVSYITYTDLLGPKKSRNLFYFDNFLHKIYDFFFKNLFC
jgi:hypothetical protein